MPAKQNPMPTLALVFGIGALLSMMFGGTVLFGSMGIVFALLSRTDKMETKARVGCGLSLLAIVIYALIVGTAMYMLMASGAWDRILAAASELDLSSANAPGDLMAIIQKEILAMYETMMNRAAMGGFV